MGSLTSLRRSGTVGKVRYWFSGDAHQVVVDQDGERIKVAVVGCEPTHPLLGFIWLDEWRWVP